MKKLAITTTTVLAFGLAASFAARAESEAPTQLVRKTIRSCDHERSRRR